MTEGLAVGGHETVLDADADGATPPEIVRDAASVSLHGVSKVFKVGDSTLRAVDDVHLDIDAGQFVALMGASGSGKSTLLHLIAAIEPVDAGEINVGGYALHALSSGHLSRYRRTIGLVFQRYHLLPALTALDNVVAPVLPFRTGFDKRARAKELLALVGLEGREGSLPSRMSGGQQQRVAIARALIGRPQLLLADEPTGNLDSQTGAEVLDLLVSLQKRWGMTVIMATHDESIAARCGRVIRLRDGRIADDSLADAGSGAGA